MDLDALRVFAAVAEASSFSGAAKKLGVPKSSVSREVARLEAEMGVRLLHRTTRTVALSSAGQSLFERVGPLVDALAKAVAELPDLEEEPAGVLRVTCAADFGAAVLAPIIARYVARYPGVRVDVWLTNRVVDLVAEGFDLALRMSTKERLDDSSLSARRLGPLTLQLFASPRYLARRGVPKTEKDLAEHDTVVFRGGAWPLEGQSRVICDDMFFARAAVREDVGVGLLPTFLADPDLATGDLVRVLPQWTTSSGSVWIVYPGGRGLPPKVTAFRDLVIEALKG